MRRLTLLRRSKEAPLTAAEHALQRRRVEAAARLSASRAERRDEAATQARLYTFPPASRRVENVQPYKPDPAA